MTLDQMVVVITTTGSYGKPDNRVRPSWFSTKHPNVVEHYDRVEVRFVQDEAKLEAFAYPESGYWVVKVIQEPENLNEPALVVVVESVDPFDMGDDRSPWGKGKAIKRGRSTF